ncbi:uncharacterized protein Z518_06512 [Rhinocladiella mackenziei CBS 650.93]|uniref:Rhinocladiella mackenziei CBS 650.93 unplaced genomic scaffold supercont1.5, whole genome shotgun sequence n=1 Tax=Rhinocladiella mackenziei CBS 650.93 TaxID=1442369 RepID=A0A0D2FLV3_9EURO|nr:uncharacterized protein Z518_06512 [Rhinocladiella mackenziei CBS 650.93]KIX02962.1 hypothetical protein Z518_06512 [Rhinocladiella mackenziei CBS 650.93]
MIYDFRGPAKGYVEALEIRLKETERVLWRLLSVTTNNNLSAAFSSEIQSRTPATLSLRTLVTTAEKKSAIAYWEQFPLQTAQEVLGWKEDVESEGSPMSSQGGAPAHARNTNTPLPDHDHDRMDSASASYSGGDTSSSDDMAGEEHLLPPPPPPWDEREVQAHTSYPTQQPTMVSRMNQNQGIVGGNENLPQESGSVGRPSGQGLSPHMPTSNSDLSLAASRFGLTKEFQETFLW